MTGQPGRAPRTYFALVWSGQGDDYTVTFPDFPEFEIRGLIHGDVFADSWLKLAEYLSDQIGKGKHIPEPLSLDAIRLDSASTGAAIVTVTLPANAFPDPL